MKDFYNNYLNDKIELEKYQIIGIICLVIVISGVFGWVYEFIFYFFNSGMKTFYYQGGNFLPWINIYAIGSILIMLFTNKYKKKPVVIFLLSVVLYEPKIYLAKTQSAIFKSFSQIVADQHSEQIIFLSSSKSMLCSGTNSSEEIYS